MGGPCGILSREIAALVFASDLTVYRCLLLSTIKKLYGYVSGYLEHDILLHYSVSVEYDTSIGNLIFANVI